MQTTNQVYVATQDLYKYTRNQSASHILGVFANFKDAKFAAEVAIEEYAKRHRIKTIKTHTEEDHSWLILDDDETYLSAANTQGFCTTWVRKYNVR